MHVPYSMDDSEPDLYGGMGGQRFDDEAPDWEPPVERMYSETEVREIMRKMVAKHQEAIDELRQELLKWMYDKL